MTNSQRLDSFDNVERVVADPLRFKAALAIGEDAYASLRLSKYLGDAWDSGGAAATGAAIAASPTVASTFFSYTATGGIFGWLGLGAAAATPAGWIIAAAFASGGAYYGVVRLARNHSGSRVEKIPKFINTPLDLLGASLLDLIGGLASRMAWIDGDSSAEEQDAIASHFIEDWGLDPNYVHKALNLIMSESSEQRIVQLAEAVSLFVEQNPDCNPNELRAKIISFLRDVAEADGPMNEHEELALNAVSQTFKSTTSTHLSRLNDRFSQLASGTSKGIKSRFTQLRKFGGE